MFDHTKGCCEDDKLSDSCEYHTHFEPSTSAGIIVNKKSCQKKFFLLKSADFRAENCVVIAAALTICMSCVEAGYSHSYLQVQSLNICWDMSRFYDRFLKYHDFISESHDFKILAMKITQNTKSFKVSSCK